MIRTLFVMLLVFSSSSAFAGKAKPSKKFDSCKAKVTALIKTTAKAMGLKEEFGIPQIEGDPDGQDNDGNPLTTFNSGIFLIDEGYISDSGATVTVRGSESSNCEIIRLSVNIGNRCRAFQKGA